MGEQALWQEVLQQAIDDAIKGVPTAGGNSKENRDRMTQQARDHLTRSSEGLATVCALAGLDMEAVIYRMRVRLATKRKLPKALQLRD